MRWLFFVLCFSGCASLHSSLAAERGDLGDGRPYAATCMTRTEEDNLGGGTRELRVGQRSDGSLAISSLEDDVTIWGKSASYAFGQICASRDSCEDYLFFQLPDAMLWVRVDTVRPASSPETFAAQLEEGGLISHVPLALASEKQRALFAKTTAALIDAGETRSGVLAFAFTTVTEISASITEASAMIDLQMSLGELFRIMNEHDIVLQGGKSEDVRVFEVVRAVCLATTKP